jgi:two-component system, NtrC family, nitrogen regulation sensor histidine kinase NtrY
MAKVVDSPTNAEPATTETETRPQGRPSLESSFSPERPPDWTARVAKKRQANLIRWRYSKRDIRPKHDRRVMMMALVSGLPAVLISLVFLWSGPYTSKVQWTLTVLILGFWLGFAYALRERVVYPLQTLSNLLAALREGDFSIRARGATQNDPLGEAMLEVNYLGQVLKEQRLGALEATALLRTVMAEIDVAVFAFDSEQELRLVNRAGERLLAQAAERILGRNAAEIGLEDCLMGESPRTVQMSFPGGTGRWEIRRSTFREHGVPHQLLVLSDLSRVLREEERQAWQRLVRVLGHELNNSLAPIKSIAGSLEQIVVREPQPPDWKEDMQRGLAVIASRAASLSRFMEAYSRLARLPQPRRQPLSISALVNRVARLETRMHIEVFNGPELTIRADGDQIEQLLINLVRNAVDAATETGGGVGIGWRRANGQLEVRVEDEGPGLSNTSNLFVPFFTTKPGGSGIGLVLSRQIAEAHGGALTLEQRRNARGCVARLVIPL